jgi:hypothetical protein
VLELVQARRVRGYDNVVIHVRYGDSEHEAWVRGAMFNDLAAARGAVVSHEP